MTSSSALHLRFFSFAVSFFGPSVCLQEKRERERVSVQISKFVEENLRFDTREKREKPTAPLPTKKTNLSSPSVRLAVSNYSRHASLSASFGSISLCRRVYIYIYLFLCGGNLREKRSVDLSWTHTHTQKKKKGARDQKNNFLSRTRFAQGRARVLRFKQSSVVRCLLPLLLRSVPFFFF